MFKPSVVLSRGGSNQNLTTEQIKRRQHAYEMHGQGFYAESVHRLRHEQSKKAVEMLRDPEAKHPDVWLAGLLMIAHEHEEEDY